MLVQALPDFPRKVQTRKKRIPLFQKVHHPQGLEVMIETSMFLHQTLEGIFTGMSKWTMTQIVGKRNDLYQISV